MENIKIKIKFALRWFISLCYDDNKTNH